MFGTLGGPELILILVLALIVFGPRASCPRSARAWASMLAEFRKASNDFKRTIEDEVEAEKTASAAPRAATAADARAPRRAAARPPAAAARRSSRRPTREPRAPPPASSRK